MVQYNRCVAKGHVAHQYKTNSFCVHTMGNYMYALEKADYPSRHYAWSEQRLKRKAKEYAEVIAELNIHIDEQTESYKKLINILTEKLIECNPKSETELELHFKTIRFDITNELRMAGY